MTTASKLADTLGRRAIADAVGVGLTAVSNAVVRGWFPASWYVACQNLASEKNCDCPPALFGMRVNSSQDVDAASENQGDAA